VQTGRLSSHFFFLRRHVPHPVFDLTCDDFLWSRTGRFLGRPRFLEVGEASWSSGSTGFASSNVAPSSSSSILGTTDEVASSSLSGVIAVSVARSGEDPEVVEYVELEKVLRLRARAAGSRECASMPRKRGRTTRPVTTGVAGGGIAVRVLYQACRSLDYHGDARTGIDIVEGRAVVVRKKVKE